ncbi:hypothetical protein [Portibacter lacus]|uniref:Uncharacterized protein n=1 Tax=Portibacter lacus TaxID=1099794 RepID=A0AA37WF72_9BACT|nr:hypothetical protein [Portibacter lacus]GLR19586.1 hypothetical protein GCM10007940_42020 [Portibacter lacus]
MSPIGKLYLKVFLLLGLPFSMGMTIFDIILGDGFSIFKFIFLFVFFGLFMSLFLVAKQKRKLKELGVSDYTDSNLKVNQTATLVSKLNFIELSQKLQDDVVLGKMNFDQTKDSIKLSSGASWRSWGEIISIQSKELTDGKYEYSISSRPKMKSTIIDSGKNLENVMAIQRALENVA